MQTSAHITSESMSALGSNCLSWAYLDVIRCLNISEPSIYSIIGSCRYLKQFNVTQCVDKQDSQLQLRISKFILQHRSSYSCEEMISYSRGRKSAQNLLSRLQLLICNLLRRHHVKLFNIICHFTLYNLIYITILANASSSLCGQHLFS